MFLKILAIYTSWKKLPVYTEHLWLIYNPEADVPGGLASTRTASTVELLSFCLHSLTASCSLALLLFRKFGVVSWFRPPGSVRDKQELASTCSFIRPDVIFRKMRCGDFTYNHHPCLSLCVFVCVCVCVCMCMCSVCVLLVWLAYISRHLASSYNSNRITYMVWNISSRMAQVRFSPPWPRSLYQGHFFLILFVLRISRTNALVEIEQTLLLPSNRNSCFWHLMTPLRMHRDLELHFQCNNI